MAGKRVAESVEVRAAQRVVPGQVQMVADEHHVARLVFGVQAARGVGEDDDARAEREDRAQKEGRLALGVSLVRVGPPREDHRAASRARSRRPARRRGPRRTRWAHSGSRRSRSDARSRVEELDDAAEPRAEDDGQLRARQARLIGQARADGIGRLRDASIQLRAVRPVAEVRQGGVDHYMRSRRSRFLASYSSGVMSPLSRRSASRSSVAPEIVGRAAGRLRGRGRCRRRRWRGGRVGRRCGGLALVHGDAVGPGARGHRLGGLHLPAPVPDAGSAAARAPGSRASSSDRTSPS